LGAAASSSDGYLTLAWTKAIQLHTLGSTRRKTAAVGEPPFAEVAT